MPVLDTISFEFEIEFSVSLPPPPLSLSLSVSLPLSLSLLIFSLSSSLIPTDKRIKKKNKKKQKASLTVITKPVLCITVQIGAWKYGWIMTGFDWANCEYERQIVYRLAQPVMILQVGHTTVLCCRMYRWLAKSSLLSQVHAVSSNKPVYIFTPKSHQHKLSLMKQSSTQTFGAHETCSAELFCKW